MAVRLVATLVGACLGGLVTFVLAVGAPEWHWFLWIPTALGGVAGHWFGDHGIRVMMGVFRWL
jgi:hypothetical protein